MNQVNLIGRLTKDIELKKTNSGKSFTRFTLAVNRIVKKENQQGPTADFIQCVAWNQTADALANFCSKGSQIGVNGSIETGSYQNQQGQTIYTTDVLVNRMDLLDTRNNNSNSNTQQGYQSQGYQPEEKVPFQNTARIEINDDDLPFY